MRRIVTIQDLSCFGKCSTTVALSVLSAAGIEVCPLPIMLLSSHTGYEHPAKQDTIAFAENAADHWQQSGFSFDAIYVGYLGSARHLSFATSFIERFRRDNTLVVVDPAMADNGKLYGGLPADFPSKMAALCAQADIVLPNVTEAALLTGSHYPGEDISFAQAQTLLDGLSKLGARNTVLTGVGDGPGTTGAVFQADALIGRHTAAREPGYYHGTGDLFASVLTAAAVEGLTLESCVEIAVDFTLAVVQRTALEKRDRWEGLVFEPLLPQLSDLIAQMR